MIVRLWRILLQGILAIWVISLPPPSAVEGFSAISSPSPNAAVRRVQLVETEEQDWNALADIRYDEWILEDDGGNGGTSRQAFRAATRDIYKEERPRSLLFLAKQERPQQSGHGTHVQELVVGAAEMSPYEVEVAQSADAPFSALYVTDVVTDSKFRRQGIARMLMQQMEEHAAAAAVMTTTTTTTVGGEVTGQSSRHLVLNVARDNDPAIRFYGSLGYHVPSLEFLEHLNVQALEDAAGTQGQLLLEKKIDIPSTY